MMVFYEKQKATNERELEDMHMVSALSVGDVDVLYPEKYLNVVDQYHCLGADNENIDIPAYSAFSESGQQNELNPYGTCKGLWGCTIPAQYVCVDCGLHVCLNHTVTSPHRYCLSCAWSHGRQIYLNDTGDDSPF